MKKIISISAFLVVYCLCFSQQQQQRQLSGLNDVSVLIPQFCIDEFNSENKTILRLYFLGNPRWDFYQGLETMYASRNEIKNGKIISTSKSFFSKLKNIIEIPRNEVFISFEKCYLNKDDDSSATYFENKSKNKNIKLTITKLNTKIPVYSSKLIIKGNYLTIEIHEQSYSRKREFTEKILSELNDELSCVLKYYNEINNTGIMPVNKFYPIKPDSIIFNILNGFQPGMYDIQAGLKLKSDGVIFMKVFNTQKNEQLSSEKITKKTTMNFILLKNKYQVFQYETNLIVYEGNWQNKYEARFEIWFKDKSGREIKLAEKQRLINGWQR